MKSIYDYSVVVYWSESDNEFAAKCIEIPGCTLGGKDINEVVMSVYDEVEENINLLKEFDLEPPRPQKYYRSSKLLIDVQRQMNARVDDGTDCPCCFQYIKRYKRKLSADMARCLISLVKIYDVTKTWVDIKKISVRNGDYARMVHWGLIENMKNEDPKKRTSGFWRPTETGIAFVYAEISIPKHVYLLRNEVDGFSKERTDIFDALGERFDYQELMNG